MTVNSTQIKNWVYDRFKNAVSETLSVNGMIYCPGPITGRLRSVDIEDEQLSFSFVHTSVINSGAQKVSGLTNIVSGTVTGDDIYVPNADAGGIITIPSKGLYAITGQCVLSNFTSGDIIIIKLYDVVSNEVMVTVEKTIGPNTTNDVITFSHTFVSFDNLATYRMSVQNESWLLLNPDVISTCSMRITRIK